MPHHAKKTSFLCGYLEKCIEAIKTGIHVNDGLLLFLDP